MFAQVSLPSSVNIVEVSPRDGLQNESNLPLAVKVDLIDRLSQTGLNHIEAGAFVSQAKVPQMAESQQVFEQISRSPNIVYSALTPNLNGLQTALACGVDQIAVFSAASEAFCQRNINCSINQSLERFQAVIELANQYQIPVRGYLSCIVDCPYSGSTDANQVAAIANTMLEMGCYEISLGDTVGTGTPIRIANVIEAVSKRNEINRIAAHFHDTYGQALANLYQALTMGVNTIDTSVAGLGGCPYATGAAGNVATEDVLYLCQGLNIDSGVALDKVIDTAWHICRHPNKQPSTKVALANRPATR